MFTNYVMNYERVHSKNAIKCNMKKVGRVDWGMPWVNRGTGVCIGQTGVLGKLALGKRS